MNEHGASSNTNGPGREAGEGAEGPSPAALDRRREELEVLAARLALREQRIAEREANADRGFAQQREAELKTIRDELEQLQILMREQRAELARRGEEGRNALEADLAKRRKTVSEELQAAQRRNDDRLARLAKEMEDRLVDQQRRLTQRELDLAKRAEEASAALEDELARRRKSLDEEVQALQRAREALGLAQMRHHEEKQRDFEELSRLQQQGLASELTAAREDFAKLRAEMRSTFLQEMAEQQRLAAREEERLRDSHAALVDARNEARAGLEQARAEIRFHEDRNRHLEASLATLQDHWDGLGGGRPEDIRKRFEEQSAELRKLREENSQRASIEDTKQLRSLQMDLVEKQVRIVQLSQTVQVLQTVETERVIVEGQYETARRQKEGLLAQLRVLKGIVAEQQKSLDDLEARTKAKESDNERIRRGTVAWNARIGDLEAGPLEGRSVASTLISEADWLKMVRDRLAGSQMIYSERLLDSFHTCLKIAEWAPLTVLSGVSGTGKSELPRLYARFGGLHFDSVAVQPNWDSPQDVFGFYNYMDNRFAARRLLRAMAQSQRPENEGGTGSQMLLVLLDEMNLARVELYLSDLLSKWELRRGEAKDWVKLEFDLGPDCEKYEVPLGSNVIFVGTVNEDESTQTLSDKVLDRGNLLYFPRPKDLFGRSRLELLGHVPMITHAQWRQWIRLPPVSDEDRATDAPLAERCEHYRGVVQRINGHLGRVERALGHRVWQSIELYLRNHPKVVAAGSDSSRLHQAVQVAFEDQIVQRVVPKLRGLVRDGNAGRCLEDIEGEIDLHANGLLDDYQAALTASDRGFAWFQSTYVDAG
jgi:hypothetical protein